MEMTSKMQILIMYAKSYEIKEDGKDTMRGVTVNYFFYGSKGEHMKPQRPLKPGEARFPWTMRCSAKSPLLPAFMKVIS